MTTFQSIVEDIRSVKIQGAQNVAQAAAKAISIITQQHLEHPNELVKQLDKARKSLQETRPTEPAMRNVLHFLLYDIENNENIPDTLNKRQLAINNHFNSSKDTISQIGEKKIKSGEVVFTHCHSSTVTNILKTAKRKHKTFKVFNTETRPIYQGRITAKELARAGIPVVHFVDSAGRMALKEADIMLIGADAISSDGQVFNKIGSQLFAEIADKYDVPLYVCTDSWKFNSKSLFGYEEINENRPSKEVWPTVPDRVEISNPAFEKIEADLITGIISELGVYNSFIFIEEVKKAYPWMF